MSETGQEPVSMLELFRVEMTRQLTLLEQAVQACHTPSGVGLVHRTVHSIKGAARLVGLGVIEQMALKTECYLNRVMEAGAVLSAEGIDGLQRLIGLLRRTISLPESELTSTELGAFAGLNELISAMAALEAALAPAADKAKPAKESDAEAAEKHHAGALIDSQMLALFCEEVDIHTRSLIANLLACEGGADESLMQSLMRAAHSIKGAAKLAGVRAVQELSHQMEDVFVAAQKKLLTLTPEAVDLLLKSVDVIKDISILPLEVLAQQPGCDQEAARLVADLSALAQGRFKPRENPPSAAASAGVDATLPGVTQLQEKETAVLAGGAEQARNHEPGRVLKVTAERWDRMMGLAGEVKVEAGHLHGYLDALTQLKRQQGEIMTLLGKVRDEMREFQGPRHLLEKLTEVTRKVNDCQQRITNQISDADLYEQRICHLADKLHKEAIRTKMRPFHDGVQNFRRMVRDIAKSLDKKVSFQIRGETTQVDRDVLEKIEASLNHLLRNALDHAIELPDRRRALGKPETGTIVLSAAHVEGMLLITIEDDGAGIDVAAIRRKVVQKNLAAPEVVSSLSDGELLEFMFLPGFSTRDNVTELSGRGVGLDVVRDAIQALHGSIKVSTALGRGTKFSLKLPLTLSVMSTLVAVIAEEHYAFPLSRIMRVLRTPAAEVELVEGHQYVSIDGQQIGILSCAEALELDEAARSREELTIVVISDHTHVYGVVVDTVLGQRELAVQNIDRRLGRHQNVSAYALLEDGSTVFIIDVDDLVKTIDALVKGGRISRVRTEQRQGDALEINRILIVDDSITVREIERKLLTKAGYRVDVAVDGVDGWNAVRSGAYDLVITDIDMPRMDGIELVKMIKGHARFAATPVIIVSYKDRSEDRKRGMEAGADYYLTKGSFHDDSFLHAVFDLIGEAVK
ncbi:MAG: response regulator [Pseudomonadota bacterium]